MTAYRGEKKQILKERDDQTPAFQSRNKKQTQSIALMRDFNELTRERANCQIPFEWSMRANDRPH